MGGIELREGGSGELAPDQFDDLKNHVEHLAVRRARRMGVAVRLLLQNDEHIKSALSIDADEQLFGAALGHLPLAAMMIETNLIFPTRRFDIPRDVIDTNGRGEYDHLDAPDTATASELLDDMLRRSGSTPFRILSSREGVGGPAVMNYFYQTKAWTRTRISDVSDSKPSLNETTASEALRQLQTIVTGTNGNGYLRMVASDALEHNETYKYGIRQRVEPQEDIKIFNKTAEYPGDEQDDRAYRHDVGMVDGPTGRVWYAFLTSSNKVGRGLMANGLIGQMTADIAVSTGARQIRTLGETMLKRRK